jgi:hypothetical protein
MRDGTTSTPLLPPSHATWSQTPAAQLISRRAMHAGAVLPKGGRRG